MDSVVLGARADVPGRGRLKVAPRASGLTRDGAAILARIEGVVAPERLYGELVGAERDVLGVLPRALVAVLACLRVVPAVLDRVDVVRISHGLGVLVAGHNAVA